MLKGPLVFVDVDTQRDFLDPAGALYLAASVEILPNLRRLTDFAAKQNIPVLATACAHRLDDPELKVFPPHCIAHTPGQERVPATACPSSIVLDVDERLDGELPAHLTILKREVDVFSRSDAVELVTRYNRNFPTWVVYGVATDHCVRAAVDGLMQSCCKVAIVVDAIRAIDVSAEPALLSQLARAGALLTLTEVVCETF
jgi:nicotinamidase/pyrazinamidase